MFNKLNNSKTYDGAKKMQNALSGEVIMAERRSQIVMNGNMEITSVTINDGLSKESLEGMVQGAVNDAIEKHKG